MAERITITVAAGGEDAEARAFGQAFREILDVLDAIAKDKTVGRIVAMEKNSPPAITLESSRDTGAGRKLVDGIVKLQGEVAYPFSLRGMRAIKRMGAMLRNRKLDSILIQSCRPIFH